MEEISHFKPRLHIFICINDRTGDPENTTPSCGPTITKEKVKEIKRWIQENGWTRDIYCTKVSCLGFCNSQGGVICIYPSGRFVKGIRNIEEIKKIIEEEMEKI